MGHTGEIGKQRHEKHTEEALFTVREQQLLAPEVFEGQLQQLREAQQPLQTADTLALYREKTAEMKDTAKLGRISVKGEKSVRQAKNEKIRRGRALTAKATAYTEEIHAELAQLSQDTAQKELQLKLHFLEQYRFTPQMFVSGSIRANFKEYVSLVRSYRELKRHAEEVQDGELLQRLSALTPIMEAFAHRMTVYCEQNRVSLDGEILSDKQSAAQLTQQEIEGWYELVTAQAQDTAELPAAPEAALSAEELRQQYFEATALREDFEAQEDGEPAILEQLKLQEQRAQAYYLLASRKEAMERQGADGAENAGLSQEIAELQADIKRLEQRKIRMEMGLAQGERRTETARRTREEAISTHSDQNSYASRDRLAALNRSLAAAGGAADTVAAIAQYVGGTRYRVGYTKERERLQAAMAAVEKAMHGENGEQLQRALSDIRAYFDRMTNGSLVVPEGAKILDYSKERPKESGSAGRGSTRNALIRKAVYWSDQKDTPLFAHEPTINDLKQRLVSNCYMMASTAGLVEFSPQLLKDCIVDEGETVVVRLYEWQEVADEEQQAQEVQDEELLDAEVQEGELQKEAEEALEDDLLDDDLLADLEEFTVVPKSELRPIYVRVSKEIPRIAGADALSAGALWMQMIEKACAFVGRNGAAGYQSLWYGEGGGFLERLLGVSPEYVDTDDADALFEEIRTGRERGYVYNAGSDASAGSEDGLNGGHAYTVMGAKKMDGKKYILLRNPYSTYSLQYEDGKKSRTGDLVNLSSDETYGQFYIELSDFVQKFGRVSRTNVNRAGGGQ